MTTSASPGVGPFRRGWYRGWARRRTGMGWRHFWCGRLREGELAFREAADRLAALEQQLATQDTEAADLSRVEEGAQ